MRARLRWIRRALLFSIGGGLAASAVGCAQTETSANDPPADASLSALQAGTDNGEQSPESEAYVEGALAAMDDFRSLDLEGESAAAAGGVDADEPPREPAERGEQARDEADAPDAVETADATDTATISAAQSPAGPEAVEAGADKAAEPQGGSAQEVAAGEATPSRPLAARIEAVVGELRALLAERGEQELSPVPGAVRDLLLAHAVGEEGEGGGAGEPPDGGDGLSEPERQVLAALGSVLEAMSDEAVRTGTVDPVAALAALDEARRTVAAAGGMRLVDAALCARVRGLGDYDPFEPAVFLRGRSIPLVVYAEARGFASEPYTDGGSSGGGARWRSRLELSVRLYSEADGTEVWRDSGGGAVMEGRRARSRAHLTALISLPARLSVGSYRMRVELSDRLTGASDERLIPVRLVADPDLATATPR